MIEFKIDKTDIIDTVLSLLPTDKILFVNISNKIIDEIDLRKKFILRSLNAIQNNGEYEIDIESISKERYLNNLIIKTTNKISNDDLVKLITYNQDKLNEKIDIVVINQKLTSRINNYNYPNYTQHCKTLDMFRSIAKDYRFNILFSFKNI
jgi:hypothetical protein